MSRHNRRRTRGGHKGKGVGAGAGAGMGLLDHADAPDSLHLYYSGSGGSSSGAGSPSNSVYSRGSMNAFGARHWHNRYMAWQARDRRQHEQQQLLQQSLSLEATKRRMFGEPSGGSALEDDEALCHKMLEYFGRLDFIE